MTLKALKFRPGVNRENTTLTNEGPWFESDQVRDNLQEMLDLHIRKASALSKLTEEDKRALGLL
jgi:hypothetical protein